MSVLEDLRGLENRVVERLRELRPLLDEYEELRRVADQFGIDLSEIDRAAKPRARARKAPGSPAARKRAGTRRPAESTGRRRAGGTRATGSERRAQLLALVEKRPGITVSELSRELGVDPPPLYRVVRKLQAEGIVTKEGKNLRLA